MKTLKRNIVFACFVVAFGIAAIVFFSVKIWPEEKFYIERKYVGKSKNRGIYFDDRLSVLIVYDDTFDKGILRAHMNRVFNENIYRKLTFVKNGQLFDDVDIRRNEVVLLGTSANLVGKLTQNPSAYYVAFPVGKPEIEGFGLEKKAALLMLRDSQYSEIWRKWADAAKVSVTEVGSLDEIEGGLVASKQALMSKIYGDQAGSIRGDR